MDIRKLFYRACRREHCRRAIKQLHELERQWPAPHTRLAVPFIFRGAGFFKHIRPMQSQLEIGELYRRIADQRPKVVVEIGTCHGGTLYLWCQASDPQAIILSIDLPEGDFGGGYDGCRAELYRAFASEKQSLHLLRADSHSPQTLAQIKELITPHPIDFLFIDGDHTYEGVKQDFQLYSQLVADNGIIALHDITPRSDEPRIEVWKFWQELKKQYSQTVEWVDRTPGGRAIGIGMVQWRR